MSDDIFGQSTNQSSNSVPTTDQPMTQQPVANYIDEYVPPQPVAAADPMMAAPQPVAEQPADPIAAPTPTPASVQTTTQSLEDQNIFTLLGVEDGSDEEKEAFLDELQQVIWEDFLDNDVELLLTEQEMIDLKLILNKEAASDLEKQEEAVVFLEKLIPDLEEIMLEKALELKEAMVRERLAGLKEFYRNDPSKNEMFILVDKAFDDGLWQEAARLMNSIK